MKRKLILLALAAALLLTACGKTETVNEPTGTPGETPAPTEAPAPTETPAPEASPEGLTPAFIAEDKTEEIRARVAEAAEGVSIREELERVNALSDEYAGYVSMADTQADMTQLAQWPYLVWDTELNQLWDRLRDTLSPDDMEELTTEELVWIGLRDEAAAEAVSEFREGSIYPMLYAMQCADLTRNRAYILGSVLARGENESFDMPDRGIVGQYLDTAGTDTVHKRLVIKAGMESGYVAVLSVSGVGTAEGSVERADDGRLLFTGDDPGLTGEIVFGWTGASFTVKTAGEGPFRAGDVYILPTVL